MVVMNLIHLLINMVLVVETLTGAILIWVLVPVGILNTLVEKQQPAQLPIVLLVEVAEVMTLVTDQVVLEVLVSFLSLTQPDKYLKT